MSIFLPNHTVDKKKSVRESNLELLRLVCMYYIVIHHLLTHALHQVAGYDQMISFSKYTIISTVLDSFLYVAVNAFVLISGFFSIKLKSKKLIHLYVICASYGALFYFMHLHFSGQSIGKTFLFQSLFVISNTQDFWFIQSYFFLCLFSPVLNRSIENMNKNEHLIVIFLLTFLNVYFGFFWHNPINSDGYNVMNFIFLYMIGSYIKMYVSIQDLIKSRRMLIWGYLFLSIIFGCLILFNTFVLKENGLTVLSWAYNHPIILITSILFFCIFLTFNMSSKWINWLAGSVLSVYLIHENSYLRVYLYELLKKIYNYPIISDYLVLKYFFLILFAMLLLLVCILFDKMFQKIIRPVENILVFLWSKIEAKYATLVK